jgi:hypothetical protein
MANRRTFLGRVAALAAALLAAPRSVWPISLWKHSRRVQVTAALGSTEDIIEMLADSADITDPDSMRPLVDLVLAHNNSYFPPMSPAIEDLIKTKLIEAEIAYRQGRGAGVREQSLADAFNALAAKFHSTASGLTSQLQVRLLRMQLSLFLPKFMQIQRIDESVGPIMAPLQAAAVMKELLVSKRGIAAYQIPPAEWDRSSYQPGIQALQVSQQRLEQIRVHRQIRPENLRLENAQLRRIAEQLASINPRLPYFPLPLLSSLSLPEVSRLIDDTFKRLGI